MSFPILRSNRFSRDEVSFTRHRRLRELDSGARGARSGFCIRAWARVWWPSVKSKSTSSTLGLRGGGGEGGGHCVVIIAISYYIWWYACAALCSQPFLRVMHSFVQPLSYSVVVRHGINKLSPRSSFFFFKDTGRDNDLLSPSSIDFTSFLKPSASLLC